MKLLKNFIYLLLGMGTAQVISVIGITFVSRLFGPNAIGTYNLVISIVSFLTIITTLSLEKAIILPKNDVEANKIVKLIHRVKWIIIF